MAKQSKTAEEKAKQRERLAKWAKRLTIAVALLVPLSWGITTWILGLSQEAQVNKKISIARLDEQGLTDDPLLVQEQILGLARSGIIPDYVAPNGTAAACYKFQEDIENEFWLDDGMIVNVSRSQAMSMLSVSITVNTFLDPQLIADFVFEEYETNELYLQLFNRVALRVNGKFYEQSRARIEKGLPLVSDDTAGLSSGSFSNLNISAVPQLEVIPLDGLSYFIDAKQNRLIMQYTTEDTLNSEQLLMDVQNIFLMSYLAMDTDPSRVIIIDISTGSGDFLIWLDLFRVYQFGVVYSQLEEIGQQVHLLQFLQTYGRLTGGLWNAADGIYTQLIEQG